MPTAQSQFELLGVAPGASLDEIKQGYRRQMARYHPDKVQHLGQEFVDLAIRRATELTHAYDALCRRLDQPEAVLAEPPQSDPPAPPGAEADAQVSTSRRTPAQGVEKDFLRSAALSVFEEAVVAVLGDVQHRQIEGFEVALASDAKRALFRSSMPPFLLLARLVDRVDRLAVEDAWRSAARLPGDPDSVRALFVMGQELESAEELADVISAQRVRPIRAGAGMLLVPVDLRSWQSFVPADAPAAIKSIIDRLRSR